MKHMSLAEITSACQGTYHGDSDNLTKEVSSVTIDSRKIEKDSLFIAIKGARSDGHDFIPQTIKNGALCALSEKDLGDAPYSYILVDSCKQALKDLAEHYRRSLDIKVVGITGSVGTYPWPGGQPGNVVELNEREFSYLLSKSIMPFKEEKCCDD